MMPVFSIFRLLVKAGDDALRVRRIGNLSGIALSKLVDTRLVRHDMQGRKVLNRVGFRTMHRVVGFVMGNYCAGGAVRPSEDAG